MYKDNKNIIKQIFEPVLDILAPYHCLVCENSIDRNDDFKYLCRACLDSIPLAPIPDDIKLKISYSNDSTLPINNFISLFEFNTESNFYRLIYHLKYYNLYKAAEELAVLLAQRLEQFNFTDYDMIIPVPVHSARRRERGYNQSEHIAIGLSRALHIPYNISTLIRKRYTQSQTQLSSSQRKLNLLNSITILTDADVGSKRILLVDDVLTTGSTLKACAEELKSHGASLIDAATLALTNH